MIVIGKCTKPHGIKGESKFWPMNTHSVGGQTLRPAMKVWLGDVEKEIESIRGGGQIIKFKNIETPEDLKHFLPAEIKLSRNQLPTLPMDQMYLCDLLDMAVLNAELNKVGKIIGSYSNGAQEVLAIQFDDGQETIELPFVPQFFSAVNTQERSVVVHFPEWI